MQKQAQIADAATQLELENKRLENEKLKVEIEKIAGGKTWTRPIKRSVRKIRRTLTLTWKGLNWCRGGNSEKHGIRSSNSP